MTRRPDWLRRELSARSWRPLVLKSLLFLAVWALVAVPVSAFLFLEGETATVIASHDAQVSPTLDGYATLNLGPYLPNLRYPTGNRIGAQIELGKTNVSSYDELIQRYAFIGSQPEAQIQKLRGALLDLAGQSAVRGALVGLVPPVFWLLLGRRRRAEMWQHVTVRRAGVTILVGAVAVVAVVQPWARRQETFEQPLTWEPIAMALPDVPIPAEAQAIEVESGLITSGTKRLARSLFDTYARSVDFYQEVLAATEDLGERLHQPEEGQTVALLVADRHDNIGMDPVARAIADEGGATVLFDAGDDTSTGQPWEAFSLDSLHQAFEDFEHRFGVAGNHDFGPFVHDYLDELGFTMLELEPVEGPDGIWILGVDDPRSSGLGTWRDVPGISFVEQADELAEVACQSAEDGNRISTLLVHDANSGDTALEEGCVDLVIGGHIHAQLGPTRFVGENGEIGYSYTNGTTGGAAYAIAIGSKLRRAAQVTLITYEEGRPVGIQPVTVRTVGDFRVGDYIPLSYDPAAEDARVDPSPTASPSEPS